MGAAVLSCGHVELRDGCCATIGCPNFISDRPEDIRLTVASVVICAALMLWVRLATGRGAIEIIMDNLSLPGLG